MTILTKDTVIYEYLKTNIRVISEFFSNATLTFSFPVNSPELISFYEYYKAHIEKYYDEHLKVKKSFDSVTLPIVVFITSYYEQKLGASNYVKSFLDSRHELHKYSYAFSFVQDVYSTIQIDFISRSIVKEYEFGDDKIKNELKRLGTTPEGYHLLMKILNEVKEFRTGSGPFELTECDNFSISPKKVNYIARSEYYSVWIFLLFNLLFLNNKDKYAIFLSAESIKVPTGLVQGGILADKKTIDGLLNEGAGGTIINFTSLHQIIEQSISDQKSFNKLRSEVAKDYLQLINGNVGTKERAVKIVEHILSELPKFPKIDFYIGTNNHQLEFVKDIVTTTNPKRFSEVELKIGGVDEVLHNKRKNKKIFTKQRSIDEL